MTVNIQPSVSQPAATPVAKRPAILKIAAIVLVVLVLVSAGLALARNYGLLGGTTFGIRGGRTFNGNFPNGTMPNGTFPNRNGTGTFPNDNGTFPNDNGTGTFPNDGGTGTTGTRTFQGSTAFALTRVLRTVSLYLNIGLVIFGLLAAFGIWKGRKWGAVLGILIAILVLLTLAPTLLRFNFNFFNWLTIVEDVAKIALSVAVIVLLLLPAARKAYNTQAVP